ncbi:MAG: adenosylcobinamide-GDP ribazoletransferase [Tyzzerella sp.]|uniref:Adenosylcobinamide-GDP ribazoletransferase n=1 Tax=Candidatus Fimicola merdigallinarum TaxID=2840819 RepID=A0A9D9H3X8_9FIRM|nr:adenosylcobinamide-GDP ribazoletransferase [Candidatus Fimicola merdigallinarum]
MQLFIMTLRFLTRIPLPFKDDTILSNEEFSKGIIYYPLIGLIVGLINFVVFKIFSLTGSVFVSSTLAVLSGVIVTGGFHIDGLADTCDGLYSSRNKERILDIMRDSRVGTNGAIAILFDILIKIGVISSLGFDKGIFAIILSPVAGKMATPLLFNSRYARTGQGLGNIYLREKYDIRSILTVLSGVIIIGVFINVYAIIPVFVCLISAVLFRKHCEKIIGGMTGDTLGAGSEIGELIFMIVYIMEVNLL